MPVRRFVQHVLALAFAGSLIGLCAGGCVDTEATFFVRNAAAFDDECVCSPDGPLLSGGFFEASYRGSYQVCLVVQNALDTLEDRDKPRPETNHVELYAVEVSVTGPGISSSPDCPSSFTYPAKGFAEPESQGIIISLGIPQCIAAQAAAALTAGTSTSVLAEFVVLGHTTGGDELETPPFSFPITLGRGAFCTGPELEEGGAPSCGAGNDQPVPQNLCG